MKSTIGSVLFIPVAVLGLKGCGQSSSDVETISNVEQQIANARGPTATGRPLTRSCSFVLAGGGKRSHRTAVRSRADPLSC